MLVRERLQRSEIFLEFGTNRDHVESSNADRVRDIKDLIVLRARDVLVRRGHRIEASKQPDALSLVTHISKGSRDEVIIACLIRRGRVNCGLHEEFGVFGVDIGERLESTSHRLALGLVGAKVYFCDPSEQVAEGGNQARLVSGKVVELATDFD